ncbi:TPA: GxxExxY protein [Candidatus Sumerlaeota bacterium]|jgi:GxxExxY protein|nr:GxxExxY protein [Candidatus Sumerlaeota bacterium]
MIESSAERDPETFAIIGAAMEVHRRLGHGFLESVYQEALAIELAYRNIAFQREFPISIPYRDQVLSCTYKADFFCFGSVIVELKALAKLSTIEKGQLLNYLKATGTHRGLLINFGAPSLQFERMVW